MHTRRMAQRSHSKPDRERPFRAGTIAIVGRPNVGKSTLLNALLGERIAITSPHPQTTRDRIAGILTTDDAQFVFLDTPGFHVAKNRLGDRMNELAKAAADECDVCVMMTDVSKEPPRDPVRPDDRLVLEAISERKTTVLVLNKVDRVQPKERLFPVLEAYSALRDFAAVVPLSALRAQNTGSLLRALSELLPEGEPLFAEDELSDKPTRFFIGEFVREQVLKRTRQEVPHGVAVSVESFDEGARMTRIAVTVHVAKDSHKAILIGDGGTMLREIGTAARKRAEELLGCKVHLETWVKANPKWFDDPARLADLGYAGDLPKRPTRRRKRKASAPRTPRKDA
jgi:GTPase